MANRKKPAGCCDLRAITPIPAAKLERLARLAKALADPKRIEILQLIANQDGAVCACDVVDHVDLSQPTVSHHLKKLKEAGLLRSRRKGLWVFYDVDPKGAAALAGVAALLN